MVRKAEVLPVALAYFFRRPLSLPRATFSPPPKLPNRPHSCRGSTVPVSCLQLSTWSIRNQSAEAEGCVGRRSAAGPLSLRVNCRASQANHRRNFLASPATRIHRHRSPLPIPHRCPSYPSSLELTHSGLLFPPIRGVPADAYRLAISVPHTAPPVKLLRGPSLLHPDVRLTASWCA